VAVVRKTVFVVVLYIISIDYKECYIYADSRYFGNLYSRHVMRERKTDKCERRSCTKVISIDDGDGDGSGGAVSKDNNILGYKAPWAKTIGCEAIHAHTPHAYKDRYKFMFNIILYNFLYSGVSKGIIERQLPMRFLRVVGGRMVANGYNNLVPTSILVFIIQ